MQYLCSLGAELDITDKLEETPLHDACRDGRLSLVQTLYAAGCNLNLPNKVKIKRLTDRQTDRQTDGQTDKQGASSYQRLLLMMAVL